MRDKNWGKSELRLAPIIMASVLGASVSFAACASEEDDGRGVGGGSSLGGMAGSLVTFSSGGAGATSSGGWSGFGDACATREQRATLTQANLLFVVDRSGSMNCNAPEHTSEPCNYPEKQDPTKPSKWEETEAALVAALDDLEGADNVRVGLTVFPKADPVEACLVSTSPDVPILPLDARHRADIDDFLASVAPQGNTPIAGATLQSYQFLADQLRAGDLSGNTFVVLFTDGAETCDLEDHDGDPRSAEVPSRVVQDFVETDVPNATLFNIRTFVIGAPGSEAGRSLLSEIAYRGNTAPGVCRHGDDDPEVGDCHFDMTSTRNFADDLGETLRRITTDRSLSCEFELPGDATSVNLNRVNVTFTPEDGEPLAIYRDDQTCDQGANGWQYSADFSKIVLCGSACDDARGREGQVRIVLGCPTRVLK